MFIKSLSGNLSGYVVDRETAKEIVGFGALEASRRLTERMNILQSGESIEDSLELFAESLLGVFDLSGVEACGQRRILISSARIFLICRFGSKLVHPAPTGKKSNTYREYD